MSDLVLLVFCDLFVYWRSGLPICTLLHSTSSLLIQNRCIDGEGRRVQTYGTFIVQDRLYCGVVALGGHILRVGQA